MNPGAGVCAEELFTLPQETEKILMFRRTHCN